MTWDGQVPCHPVESAGLVYIENPKAGCTSVKWALSPFKGGPPDEGPKADIHQWFGYTHARDSGQMLHWLRSRWALLFRFTVVRDPAARFQSAYYGLSRQERGAYGNINRYILEYFGWDEWSKDIHVLPQTLILGLDLKEFDYIGSTEKMRLLEKRLKKETGTEIVIPHLNKTHTPASQRPHLTLDAQRRLREVYSDDYEVFKYA